MMSLASKVMKSRFARHNVASIATLLDSARELDVRLIGCQMTIDVFGYTQDDFIDGVEFGGAAAFMSVAAPTSPSSSEEKPPVPEQITADEVVDGPRPDVPAGRPEHADRDGDAQLEGAAGPEGGFHGCRGPRPPLPDVPSRRDLRL